MCSFLWNRSNVQYLDRLERRSYVISFHFGFLLLLLPFFSRFDNMWIVNRWTLIGSLCSCQYKFFNSVIWPLLLPSFQHFLLLSILKAFNSIILRVISHFIWNEVNKYRKYVSGKSFSAVFCSPFDYNEDQMQ